MKTARSRRGWFLASGAVVLRHVRNQRPRAGETPTAESKQPDVRRRHPDDHDLSDDGELSPWTWSMVTAPAGSL